MESEIIQTYLKTTYSIQTIANIFHKRKIDIGKIIQRYKKIHDIR